MSMPNRDGIAELFAKAIDGGYAIPHINHSDFGDLYAIVDAANEASTPIIAAGTLQTVAALGLNKIAAVANILGKESDVPFVIHLDHCPDFDTCIQAIECGYNSVMIDGSDFPLDQNIELVKRVVDYAHPRGVFVEGEVGHVSRGSEDSWDANVEDAVKLVTMTGVDSLAVSIGNEHGFYKTEPVLNFALLARVHEALPEVPLVLHGGTGIPVESVQKAIKDGVRKVNVGTAVRCAYVAGIRDGIAEMGIEAHTQDIIAFAKGRVKEKVLGVIDMCWARNRV